MGATSIAKPSPIMSHNGASAEPRGDRSPKREEALNEAVAIHRGPLISVIRGLVRDQVEAEDILQDVFEEFIAAYDLGASIERLGAWLVTVARNKILDRFRRKKTRAVYEESLTPQVEAPDDGTRAWIRRELVAALELLPPEQKEVFVMHELEGLSFNEIAAKTRVPLNTLLSRKKYAVDFLRNYLKEVYDELES
jgi:RNA polymerase sigma factor (sigma-70 family)